MIRKTTLFLIILLGIQHVIIAQQNIIVDFNDDEKYECHFLKGK
jgi:hypothetical protein